MNFTYSENIHRPVTIERVAGDFIEALKSLITHCQSQEAGGYTPSDFPMANLKQEHLDKILKKLKGKKEVRSKYQE